MKEKVSDRRLTTLSLSTFTQSEHSLLARISALAGLALSSGADGLDADEGQTASADSAGAAAIDEVARLSIPAQQHLRLLTHRERQRATIGIVQVSRIRLERKVEAPVDAC